MNSSRKGEIVTTAVLISSGALLGLAGKKFLKMDFVPAFAIGLVVVATGAIIADLHHWNKLSKQEVVE
jgi:NhaP-type Na+/H+ or K+/H+ antiporter